LYGPASAKVEMAVEMHAQAKWVLTILVILVLVLGVYPQPLIRLTSDTVRALYGY
jgi:NADH-quinone oxidoreductase subunit M